MADLFPVFGFGDPAIEPHSAIRERVLKNMKEIAITIPGNPIPWQAPTFGKGRAYSKQSAIKFDYEAYIALQYPGKPLQGPLSVKFSFFMRRPRSHYGSGKNKRKVLKSAPRCPTAKPDSTNLAKFLEDRCNKTLWRDDSQVVDTVIKKRYSENPRSEIIVERLEL